MLFNFINNKKNNSESLYTINELYYLNYFVLRIINQN